MTADTEAVPRVPLDVLLPPELLRRSFENLGFGDLCSIATTATVSREECRTLFSGFFARLAAEFPRAAAEEENEAIKRCGDYADIMLEGLPALIMRMEEMKVCTDEVAQSMEEARRVLECTSKEDLDGGVGSSYRDRYLAMASHHRLIFERRLRTLADTIDAATGSDDGNPDRCADCGMYNDSSGCCGGLDYTYGESGSRRHGGVSDEYGEVEVGSYPVVKPASLSIFLRFRHRDRIVWEGTLLGGVKMGLGQRFGTLDAGLTPESMDFPELWDVARTPLSGPQREGFRGDPEAELFECLAEVRVTALLIQTSGCDKTVRTVAQLAEGRGLGSLGNHGVLEIANADAHITLASFFFSALRGRDGDLLGDGCEMEMVIHLDEEAPKITQVAFRVDKSVDGYVPYLPGLMVETNDDDTAANAHVLRLLRLLQWE